MITPGLEDYLEFIYNRIKEHKNVKAIDIANAFNISRPSVSEALIRLADLDLIIYEGRKGLKITSKGIKEAKKVVNKHKILFNFFTEILDISPETADKNACRIEHVIEKELIDRIKDFTEFCMQNNVTEEFKKIK